jgi:hypothetical protein
MKGFEQYDLQAWSDNGLSYHPKPQSTAPSRTYRTATMLSRFAFPLLALGTSAIVQATLSSMAAAPASFQKTHAVGLSRLVGSTQLPSTFLGPPKAALSAVSAAEVFDNQIAALLADVQGGALTNVSRNTLLLAEAATARSAVTDSSGQPDWIAKVAADVAKLTD